MVAASGCGGGDLAEAVRGAATARERDVVERVVDGDTVQLRRLGRARLIGIDTPEVHGGVECFGPQASRFVKARLPPGARVRVRLGIDPEDPYGRALVWLWLPGGRLLNEVLVRRGLAVPLTIEPNVERAVRIRVLAARARAERRGLWGACRPGLRPATSPLAERPSPPRSGGRPSASRGRSPGGPARSSRSR